MNSTRLGNFCERALEAGWLLGVTITPVFFNVYSSRVFEPDKLTTLRALATVMAVLWLTRFVEQRMHDGEGLRFTMRTPLVLPAAVTMVVYLLTSLTSLVRFTSILGSYQRLQGTYTLFGYLVIFVSILTGLRTRLQLSRLVTVLILNSLPISLYGIIQHNGLDPLPWAGDVTTRVASNMGNSIFVAAYLIMIVPLTASRIVESFGDILGRAEARISDVLRASGYIFVFAVQLLTIWYSQSRGPWLGIVASGFLFPYLALIVLQRMASSEEEAAKPASGSFGDILKGFGFGLGSLLAAGGLAGLAYWALGGQLGIYVSLGLALLVFGGLWLYVIVERKGWRWLWIGWGSVGLVVALGLVALNIPGPLQSRARTVSSLKRLTTITELQSGTGKVRGLIWQGTVDLLGVHDPISFPDGSLDRLNPIRPLVGYGPEAMYVAYNSFYPPELGHYESRTASPDRSHNETLDSLVVTGILGLVTYLFTFLSFFGWGFHWLGLMPARRDLIAYLVTDAACAIIFFIVGWQLEGAYLFAVSIPLGVLVGSMIYLTYQAFRSFIGRGSAIAPTTSGLLSQHPHAMLLMGLMAGVIAHFVEINFGIAIASTRTTFWAFAGLLVVLGVQWIPGLETDAGGQSQETSSRRRGRRGARSDGRRSSIPPWAASVAGLALASTFLLGTLAYDFINNPDRLGRAGQVFLQSLTTKYYPTPTRAYGALMIFVFTWALFGVIGLCEFDREGLFDHFRRKRWISAVGLYTGITLVGVLIFGFVVAGHQASLTRIEVTSMDEIVEVAESLTGLLGRYYGLIFVLLAAIGGVLVYEGPQPRRSAGVVGAAVMVVLLLVSIPVIRVGCYDLIRADIIFKQGDVFAKGRAPNEKQVGIAHFERSIEYAPHEDYYYLFLGKAYLELAQGLGEDTPDDQREEVFIKTLDVLTAARETNPLNTDHSANLARFYKSWAARVAQDLRAEGLNEASVAELQARRLELLDQSLLNYETAVTLSPNNPILWNELAQLYAIDLGDLAQYEATLAHSLAVDDEFEQTWMLKGDIASSQGNLAGGIEAYLRSLEIRDNCTVRRVVGTLYAQQASWDEAAAFMETSIPECDTDRDLWEMYRILAITYANQGDAARALETAEVSMGLAPEDQKPVVQQMIDQLTGTTPETAEP